MDLAAGAQQPEVRRRGPRPSTSGLGLYADTLGPQGEPAPDLRGQSWIPRVSAPSTTRWAPVVKLDTGLARKTIAVAISSGLPIRLVGLAARAAAKDSGLPRSIPCQKPSGK